MCPDLVIFESGVDGRTGEKSVIIKGRLGVLLRNMGVIIRQIGYISFIA